MNKIPIDSRKEILLYIKNNKEEVKENCKVYILNKDNMQKYITKLKYKILILNIILWLLIIFNIISFILFFSDISSIAFSGDNFEEIYIISIFSLIVYFLLYCATVLDYSTIPDEFFGTAIIKTDTRLIFLKAKASNKIFNPGIKYFVLSEISSGFLSLIFAAIFLKRGAKMIMQPNTYKNDIIDKLYDESEIKKIIYANHSQYHINVYENIKLLHNKKDYFVFSCTQHINSEINDKKKIKIYKVYNDINNLI